jgi:hypothetical protein
MRETFVKHPWALHSLEGARVGPNNLAHIEQSMTALEGQKMNLAEKLEMLSVVDDYVFGTVMRDREDHDMGSSFDADALNEVTKEYLATGDYPVLGALIGNREPVDAFVEFAALMSDKGRFQRGLAIILDGFAAKYGLSEQPASEIRAAERMPEAMPARRGPSDRAIRTAARQTLRDHATADRTRVRAERKRSPGRR